MSGRDSIGGFRDPDSVILDDLNSVVEVCGGVMRKLSGSSLLLTGGSGFVGRYLVESIIRFNEVSDAAPCILTLPSRNPELLISRYRPQVDANEVVVVGWPDGRARSFEGRRWDYVVHGAAATDPSRIAENPTRAFRESISVTESAVNAAKSSGSGRILLISSGAVYGDPPANTGEIPETFRGGQKDSKPTATYGEAKRTSETLIQRSGLDYRIARVFSTLGPYQDLKASFAVPDLIRQAEGSGIIQLRGSGSARRSYCYAADLTVFLLKLLLGDTRHDVYNVGCRQGTASVAEVAGMIADIFGGLEVRRAAATEPERNYVPDLERMYEVYAPRTGIREGLSRTCQSLYARGLISRRPMS